jgi:hypothetical protein
MPRSDFDAIANCVTRYFTGIEETIGGWKECFAGQGWNVPEGCWEMERVAVELEAKVEGLEEKKKELGGGWASNRSAWDKEVEKGGKILTVESGDSDTDSISGLEWDLKDKPYVISNQEQTQEGQLKDKEYPATNDQGANNFPTEDLKNSNIDTGVEYREHKLNDDGRLRKPRATRRRRLTGYKKRDLIKWQHAHCNASFHLQR